MWFEIARIAAVIALLGAAAVICRPKNSLPLALRGLRKVLGNAEQAQAQAERGVGKGKRLLAFLLVIAAVVLCLV